MWNLGADSCSAAVLNSLPAQQTTIKWVNRVGHNSFASSVFLPTHTRCVNLSFCLVVNTFASDRSSVSFTHKTELYVEVNLLGTCRSRESFCGASSALCIAFGRGWRPGQNFCCLNRISPRSLSVRGNSETRSVGLLVGTCYPS